MKSQSTEGHVPGQLLNKHNNLDTQWQHTLLTWKPYGPQLFELTKYKTVLLPLFWHHTSENWNKKP